MGINVVDYRILDGNYCIENAFTSISSSCDIMRQNIDELYNALDKLAIRVEVIENNSLLGTSTNAATENPKQKSHLEILEEKVGNEWFRNFLKDFIKKEDVE